MKRQPRQWAKSKGEKIAEGLANAQEVGECLEWPGPFGCGRKKDTAIVKARSRDSQRTENYAVARELWEAAYGPVPEGKLVYRTCCNNACVLLDHLAIGTRKEWSRARIKAGATKHHHATIIALTMAARRNAKNSIEVAREVRALRAEGMRHEDIAAQTGVAEAMVDDIVYGRAWVELSSPFAGLGART